MDFKIVNSLVQVVELKDQSTAAHTWRVALYAQALAEASGLSPDETRRLMHAAVVHDVGKIDIPSEILAKPDRLSDEEFEIIKRHTILGCDLLKKLGVEDQLVLELVRSHHERMDGSGYPDGLAGDAIPEAARAFAVIDTFDAMTSLRPYRTVTGREAADAAIRELERYKGIWYCPIYVARFADLYRQGTLDWILSHYNDEKSLGEVEIVADPQVMLRARERLTQRTNGDA